MEIIRITKPMLVEMIKCSVRSMLNEAEYFHGSQYDFDSFDLAYVGNGSGHQDYGYGIYLSTSVDVAKHYADNSNGIIYTVEIPNGKFLKHEKINKAEAGRIAKIFFKYYTEEYDPESYSGVEDEFWEYECKYIAQSQTGTDVYGTISSILGSDKKTSEFFYNKLGYVGLEWTDNGIKNYVIFNDKDIRIIKKEKVH